MFNSQPGLAVIVFICKIKEYNNLQGKGNHRYQLLLLAQALDDLPENGQPDVWTYIWRSPMYLPTKTTHWHKTGPPKL
jgi:hypothetical protein